MNKNNKNKKNKNKNKKNRWVKLVIQIIKSSYAD